MPCKVSHERLMRLHDSELSYLQALTLRRHARRCPDCRKMLTELSATDTLLQRADYFPTEIKHQPLPLRPLGLVGGLAVATGAIVFLALPGGPLRPTSSFASVEEAMGKVKTIHWKESSGGSVVWDCWADLTRRRICKQMMQGNQILQKETLKPEGWLKVIFNSPKTYFWQPLWRKEARDDYLRDHIIFSKSDPGRIESREFLGEKFTRKYSAWKKIEDIGTAEMLVFEKDLEQKTKYGNYNAKIFFWIDAETRRIIRREERSLKNNDYVCVSNDFKYNETPPPGIFEIEEPKVGEQYVYFDFSKFQKNNQRIEDEQNRKRVVGEAIATCSHRATKAFLSLWDFEAIPPEKRAARKALAQSIVENQVPYKTWKSEKIMSAHPGPTYLRKSESDPFPPLPSPYEDTVDVNVQGWVTTARTSKPYLALSTFTLTKRSGQWKIQQLQCTTEPLPHW